MKNEDIYNEWVKHRSEIEVDDGFADGVIKQVRLREQKNNTPAKNIQRFIEWVSIHRLAKTGMFAAGAIAGLFRVAFMIHTLLFGT